MEPNKQDIWKWKNEEMIAFLAEREIPFDPDNFSRKEAVDKIVQAMAEEGDLEKAIEQDEEGNYSEPKIKREYVDIVFRNQDGQAKYVFVGLHGRFLYLPRECLCRIPAEFMDPIRHAVKDKIVQYEKDGKLVNKTVRVPRLVYEIVDKGVIE